MVFNKDLRPSETALIRAKLTVLLNNIKKQYESGSFSTEEEAIDGFQAALKQFYDRLDKPFLQLRPVRKGTSPDYKNFNASFGEIENDLSVIFDELSDLEETVLSNFNFVVSEKDRLIKLAKSIDSKTGDYVLYSEDPIGNALYYKDSYNNTDKIDYGSQLLSANQCEIVASEGIVTLPVVRDGKPTTRTMKVKIDDASNGSSGNLQQIGAAPHDDITAILDSNPDTWFEYEKVQTKQYADEPLRLSLTFTLNKPQVINRIIINPNNFGQNIAVKITQVDTSFDGKAWVSIKDDIPIADFLSEDEENIFTLAPSTSKYAGQGIYTFTPRKIQYISVTLEQDTSYPIETPAGQRWRFAIGIRDIEAHGIRYEPKGDLISKSFTFGSEIQKVSLLTSENPIQSSELADVVHQISPDDGSTWYDIQPQHRVGTGVPEILNFNTGDSDAITTSVPVENMRHRLTIERIPDAFKNGAATLRLETKDATDLLAVPQLSPMKLGLNRTPVPDTILLMNPRWGSRAVNGTGNVVDIDGERRVEQPVIYRLGRSTNQNGMKFQLPISFVDGKVDRDEVVIWVDSDTSWTRVGDFSSSTSTDKHYTLSINGELQFGSASDSSKGAIPASGAYIGFTLAEETLVPTATSPYICDLVFSSDGEKSNIKIYRTDSQITGKTNKLKPGATVHRLKFKNIVEDIEVADFSPSSSAFQSRVTYVDGSSELSSNGDYSVDYDNGIIYSKTATPTDGTVITVTYDYIPKAELGSGDWDFVDGKANNYKRISIADHAYISIDNTYDLSSSSSTGVLDLGFSIVPRSLSWPSTSPFTSGASPREITYINGSQEFEKQDAALDLSGVYSVDYRNGIIYLAPGETISSSSPGTLSYKYTQFSIAYNIAKTISEDKYTVNNTDGSININESEALRVWGDRDSDIKGETIIQAKYKYVSKTRENIEELEPYFSPIVRDVVVKVLPPGV